MEASTERGDRRWWVRLRAALLLAVLLAAIGVSIALVVGIASLALGTLLDQAL